jgi:hypothetical protein
MSGLPVTVSLFMGVARAAQQDVSFQMSRLRIALLCGFLAASPPASPEETLYSLRSRDQGIAAFDLTVSETTRTKRTSVLNIPGVNSRSSQGARWLMCAYTDLALKRGFKYWAALYPSPPGEDVVVGFLDSEDQNLVQTLGAEFDSKMVLPASSAEKLAVLCGIRKPPPR